MVRAKIYLVMFDVMDLLRHGIRSAAIVKVDASLLCQIKQSAKDAISRIIGAPVPLPTADQRPMFWPSSRNGKVNFHCSRIHHYPRHTVLAWIAALSNRLGCSVSLEDLEKIPGGLSIVRDACQLYPIA